MYLVATRTNRQARNVPSYQKDPDAHKDPHENTQNEGDNAQGQGGAGEAFVLLQIAAAARDGPQDDGGNGAFAGPTDQPQTAEDNASYCHVFRWTVVCV